MDKVSQILNFIDGNVAETHKEETPSYSPQEETPSDSPQEETQEHPKGYPTNGGRIQEAQTINETKEEASPTEETEQLNKSDYSKMMKQIKKLQRSNDWPNTIKINGKNKIINSLDELTQIEEQHKQQHKEQLKRERQERIKNTKLTKLNKASDSDTITDDDYIYKKPRDVYAIKKDGESLKVPKTSKKDTKKIYKAVSNDKETLKKLVKAKTQDEFNDITNDAIQDDELKETVYNHTHNDINDDRTWNQTTLIRLLMNEMNKNKTYQRSAETPHINKGSFNPALLRR